MADEERSGKYVKVADIVVKIASGLLGIVLIIFLILFWLK